MKKENVESGNVILRSEEIDDLRKAILEKYAVLAGEEFENPDKLLNSNLINYLPLYESIDKLVSLTSIGIKSSKPLAVVFHFSKNDLDGTQSFRKKFINALYNYAYGQSRDEYLSKQRKTDDYSSAINQLKNIEGYWESYYDKDNMFIETLHNQKEASLSIVAIKIKGDNIYNNTIEYISKHESGKGTVEIQGSNLIFHLRSDKNSEPTFMFMNCGRDVEDIQSHIKVSAGIFLHINEIGSPKSGKCLMEYFDEEKLKEKYGSATIEFTDEKFKSKFTGELRIPSEYKLFKQLEKIKQFFQRGNNTTDVHLSHFATVVTIES